MFAQPSVSNRAGLQLKYAFTFLEISPLKLRRCYFAANMLRITLLKPESIACLVGNTLNDWGIYIEVIHILLIENTGIYFQENMHRIRLHAELCARNSSVFLVILKLHDFTEVQGF